MANADTPAQVVNAIQHGAVGIGLVRTEHMFFKQEGLDVLRSLLLAPANETVLHNFEVYQQQQFKELLVAAKGADIPVTIRLLDAPPEEFLNQEQLHEFKSNLGGQFLRGLPFALKAPGVYRAQLRALFEALRDSRFDGELKVMIPLVYNAGDLARIKSEYSSILQEYGDTIDQERIRFGSMIETLGAIQTAGPIAKICDFVSFGTKDLTREIVGIPRNDVAGIDTWMRENETAISPYQSLCEPVREAIETALVEINSEDTEISMCGEHVSGDFESIKFCHKFSFNCISVNPTGRVIKMSQIMLGKLRASDLKAEELEWCVADYQVSMLHDNLKAMRAINPNCADRRLPVNASLVSKFIRTAASLLGLPSESLEAHGSETRRRLIQDVVMHVLSELPLKTRAMLIADVYDLGLRISREGRAQGELRSDKTDGWWRETIQSLFRIYLVFQRLLSKAPPEGVQLADILSGLQELREKFREYLSNPPEGILESSLASLEDLTTQIALILGDDVFSE